MIQDTTAADTRFVIGNICDRNVAGTDYFMRRIEDTTAADTRYVIWTAETEFFPNTASTYHGALGTSGAHANFAVEINTYEENQNSHIRYRYVNLTPYRVLKITGALYASGWSANAGFVIHPTMNYAYYNVGGNGNSYTQMHRITSGSWSGTWFVDVSGLSGNYYITTQCYGQHGGYHKHANATITQITAED